MVFKLYKNLGGRSGIREYAYDDISIHVRVNDGKTYVYTVTSVGSANVIRMIELANNGTGLNSFIMRNPKVKKGFEYKY